MNKICPFEKVKKWLFLRFRPAVEERLHSLALLILRVGAGLMIMTHGWGKLSGYSEKAASFPDPLGIGSQLSLISAIGCEFFAAGFLVLGLFTRWAALAPLFAMIVIVFIFHGADPFNVKELGLLYGLVFLTFALNGGGRFSLDHWLLRRL